MTSDPKTLFAIRLASKRTRMIKQLFAMFLIIMGFVLFMSCIGGLQYAMCKSKNSQATVSSCLTNYNKE